MKRSLSKHGRFGHRFSLVMHYFSGHMGLDKILISSHVRRQGQMPYISKQYIIYNNSAVFDVASLGQHSKLICVVQYCDSMWVHLYFMTCKNYSHSTLMLNNVHTDTLCHIRSVGSAMHRMYLYVYRIAHVYAFFQELISTGKVT